MDDINDLWTLYFLKAPGYAWVHDNEPCYKANESAWTALNSSCEFC